MNPVGDDGDGDPVAGGVAEADSAARGGGGGGGVGGINAVPGGGGGGGGASGAACAGTAQISAAEAVAISTFRLAPMNLSTFSRRPHVVIW
jgi:hypothetical protein